MSFEEGGDMKSRSLRSWPAAGGRATFTHHQTEGASMADSCVLDPPLSLPTDQLEEDIVAQLDEHSVVHLDVLVSLMPAYSWNQIFHAVDRLARSGRIVLRRHRFDYTLFSRHYAA
jgi:hypothetical protein